MDADMQHVVVFRIRLDPWESYTLTSGDFEDWVDKNTYEQKFEYSGEIGWDEFWIYFYGVLLTRSSAAGFKSYLRQFDFVELAWA